MNKEKNFDTVQMMRTIREKVQQEWKDNPVQVEEQLKEIRKKYNINEVNQTEKSKP